MLSLPSPFCSNDPRTLSALRETFTDASQPTPNVLIRKNSDSQKTSGKGRGSLGSKKNEGVRDPPPPLPPLLNSSPHGPSIKNAKNLITPQKTLLLSLEYKKTRPRTITRGPKSYLSAHRDPKEKKEFDNATETLTRSALRPE